MDKKSKVEFYDEFRCIADRCSFSCCGGWEIIIDKDTYHRWKSTELHSGYFSKNISTKRRNKNTIYEIKNITHKNCPFLDEIGLCNIVKDYSEEYLTKTCKAFPRLVNTFGDINEYSLSCACPVVVDKINKIDGKLRICVDGNVPYKDNMPLEYSIREAMISILQNSKFSLTDKILLVFHMLLSQKNEPSQGKELLEKYQDEEYQLTLTGLWSEAALEPEALFAEKNELFLDIVQYYKNEEKYRYYLTDITELAETLNVDHYKDKWKEFKTAFNQYEKLLENCLVSKIYASCVSDDIDDMIISYQMVITEYILIQYSGFLRWMMNENDIEDTDIKDDIVLYSRIIGYNSQGMKEFWEDSFDEPIWDYLYMLLLIK